VDRELRGTDREKFQEKEGTELSVPAGVTGRIEILGTDMLATEGAARRALPAFSVDGP